MTVDERAKKGDGGGDGGGCDGGDPSEALTQCLLSQYKFFAAGVGLGGLYAVRSKKGLPVMAAAGVAGSVADMIYGYTVACKEEADRYKRASSSSSSEGG